MFKLFLILSLSFSALAVEVGEDLKGDCANQVQSSRTDSKKKESSNSSTNSSDSSTATGR
jgi:hypothetical protein